MANNKLNGSVGALAEAMRVVFTEAVREGIAPVEKRITSKIDALRADFKRDRSALRKEMKILKGGTAPRKTKVTRPAVHQ